MPPPIGGVTVHVFRLIEQLEKRNYKHFHFIDLGMESIWKLACKILRYKAIHLHTSNPYLNLVVAIYCFLLRKRLIITLHGNWNRFGFAKNSATRMAVFLSYKTLVQNTFSLKNALNWNSKATLISSFLPPGNVVPLDPILREDLLNFKSRFNLTFCTNAWNVTFDKHGKEIYGICDLIGIFENTPNCCLLISDPSGNYERFARNKFTTLPYNVLFIKESHDFCNVLKLSDAFIRNTTTDGDSISIHEAMFYEIPVFASNCVPRPAGCILFNDIQKIDLEMRLESYRGENKMPKVADDTTSQLIQIYNDSLIVRK